MRVRLKADGRIVEILADGSERAITHWLTPAAVAGAPNNGRGEESDAAYVRGVRARTHLTQTEFAARIGVPIDTVRNWEQGKRSPRGPARALLKVIDNAPDLAFAVLRETGRRTTDMACDELRHGARALMEAAGGKRKG